MAITGIPILGLINLMICVLIVGALCYLLYLSIKDLRKYMKSNFVRKFHSEDQHVSQKKEAKE